jgi:hypothetical protein
VAQCHSDPVPAAAVAVLKKCPGESGLNKSELPAGEWARQLKLHRVVASPKRQHLHVQQVVEPVCPMPFHSWRLHLGANELTLSLAES